MRHIHILAFFAAAAVLLSGCNRSEVITTDPAPVIALDNPSGVYTVKVGREVTIAPTVNHADGALYTWLVDGAEAGDDDIELQEGDLEAFPVESMAVFRETPPKPRRSLLEGFMAYGPYLTLIYGRGGSGKSLLKILFRINLVGITHTNRDRQACLGRHSVFLDRHRRIGIIRDLSL